VDWIGHQAGVAKPLDRDSIQSLVFNISGIVPGSKWIYWFEQHHPEIHVSWPGNLDPKCAHNFNPTNITHFYKLLKDMYNAHPNLPPEHIWNMDEKGVQFGGGCKHSKKYYHLQTLKKCKFYHVRLDNLELITVIECISPSGLSVPPSFILSSGPIPSFPDLSSKIAVIMTSPNGWTNNEIGTAWFTKTFIPFANSHKVSDEPIILLLNGHNSHKSDEFHGAVFQHNIIVIVFPSKCTHKLQPLDVIVFTQTQRHWSNHCDNCIIHHVKIDHYNIIQEYMEVCPRLMTPELMCSVFSTTGIFLFNNTLFTDNNFAPAKSFSYMMHISESFPAEVPSSPPAASDASNFKMSGNESNTAESIAADAPAAQSYPSWETDSDDFDYKLAPSHLTSPTAPTTPVEALPSQLPVPAVPVTGTITSSSQLVPTMLATSTISASCSSPITPLVLTPFTMSHYVGTSGLPRPSDAFSEDVGPHATHVSPYYTCSQASQMVSLSLSLRSSPTLSISIALDPTQAPQPQSVEELLSENH